MDTFADVLGTILLAGLGVVAVGTLLALGVTWYVVRRIRRSRQLARTLSRSRPTVRTVAADDVGRRLARLRLRVARSSEATESALAAAEARGAPVGPVTPVVTGLRRTGEHLDQELRHAEIEPDRELRGVWADLLADKVAEHEQLCADLRRSLVDAAASVAPAQLARTADQVLLEIEALNTWSRTYRTRGAA